MAIPDSTIRTGRCLCGSVRFETSGAPRVVAQCCCVDCQRLTGTGHSTGAMFPTDRVQLRGERAEFHLASEAGNVVTREFCPRCGSPILGRNSGMPGFVTLSLGAFEDASDLAPEVAIFTRSLRRWDSLGEAVPRFETQPGWRPDRP